MLLKNLRDEIDATFARDPAARSRLEVVLCYPGFHELLYYRLAHWLWQHRWHLAGRFASHVGRMLTGIAVHPGARIGKRLFIRPRMREGVGGERVGGGGGEGGGGVRRARRGGQRDGGRRRLAGTGRARPGAGREGPAVKLSTRGRYAVMAMVDLARHGNGSPVSLAEIAERQEISLSYLEQLFAKLRRSGLVHSVRGPGGGYLLAHHRDETRICDIIVAVDEPLHAGRCTPGEAIASPADRSRCL